MGTVTGSSAEIGIKSHAAGTTTTAESKHSLYGISDFSITLDKGTVEQELVGEIGNYFTFGSLSVEGSYTCCKFAASGADEALDNLLGGTSYQYITISGNTGNSSAGISWYFKSCQITGYDVSLGDSDTITEASIDWVVMHPNQITINPATGHMVD